MAHLFNACTSTTIDLVDFHASSMNELQKDDSVRDDDDDDNDTLKYSLLGPSLTKAGQDSVDQQKVSEIIYNASKGSKYFNNEKARDKKLTEKIDKIVKKKVRLEHLDLAHDRRKADDYIAELELSRDLSQVIVHIDCDAFYAACEELDRPELCHVPFSVGKGVLTTCNYHARKFGCRSGMAGFVAKKLCPQLIQVPLNFEKYTAKAQEVREIIVDYDPRFESASIDEAYLNITAYCEKHQMTPEEAVEQLRREVHEKTSITISGGIAANAKLAKICSNINKPNGQFFLPINRSSIMAFMQDLPTRKVNGIGRVFERELLAIGVKTCGDIYQHRQYLAPLFGEKAFRFLVQCYLGLGRTTVQPAEEYERKSVGTESTFHEMSNAQEFREKLRWTAEELEKDMLRAGFKGRTLVFKVKLHTYEVLTRQTVPPQAVCMRDDLYRYSLPMLAKLEQEIPGMKLRLMGLRCTHLVSTKKPDALTFLGFKRKPAKESPRHEAEQSGAGGGTARTKRKAVELEEHDEAGDAESFWSDSEFEAAARWERRMDELEHLSQDDERAHDANGEAGPNESEASGWESADPRRHHGKLILPNPTPKRDDAVETKEAGGEEEEKWWDCPVCSRPQRACEREFNEHIDACLSRQTIKEVVQEGEGAMGDEGGQGRGFQVVKRGPGTGQGREKKRVKGGEGRRKEKDVDPKQTRLFFG